MNPRFRKWLPWLLLAIAVIVTAAVYWPGLAGGWVFDDYPNIVDNAAIHITSGRSTFAAWVGAALSSPASFLHRPLASITFALNWYFGSGDPWPFKITNVIVHLLNGVLLFCMLRALLRLLGWRAGKFLPSLTGRGDGGEGPNSRNAVDSRDAEHDRATEPSSGAARHLLPKGEGTSNWIDDAAATRLALFVSAAWLLLPINLMAVLYVVQRMESLCQVFVLAGLWAYLHGRWMMLTASSVSRERRGLTLAIAGIVLGTALGLTSKETAVLLPVFAFMAEAVLLRFRRKGTVFERAADAGKPSDGKLDSGFRSATGPGMTRENDAALTVGPATTAESSSDVARDTHPLRHSGAARSAEPGMARENDAAMTAGPATTAESSSDVTRDTRPLRHSGAARSAEPGIQLSATGESTSGAHDRRLWALFTITLFVPAVLGFLWLLRGVLRPGALAGRDFTLAQRLLTEPRVLVDYLHWTLLPDPAVLSLYHDEIAVSTGLLSPWTTLGAILLLAALIVVAILLRNRHPLVALGIGWFFAAQLLTATIVPLELVYEQRMYFASVGVLLAVGALLLGLRWRIHWPLLRGFLVVVALVWFGTATCLRAQEWSDPLRLAVAEADRHPESARAVYEAGRQLLIASNYREGEFLTAAGKYLREASAIPGSSALADQALIMIADHQRQGDDDAYWASMTRKLRDQPTRQEDISALISLTNCHESGICVFDVDNLQRAYLAALSRPHPTARLNGAYADFQRDTLHDQAQAEKYLALAVRGAPSEPAYRIDLAALYARSGQTGQAQKQIDVLRQLNYGGRLDKQIAFLEQLIEQTTPARNK